MILNAFLVPGIDNVLGVDQALTANREIDLNGNALAILDVPSNSSGTYHIAVINDSDENLEKILQTAVGKNLLTLANPSAITFIRINADNSVSALSASDFRTAIGAGTGSGTVTSVSGTTNRVTSTGGTTPVIDISATFEALLLKVANNLSDLNNAGTARGNLGGTTAGQSIFTLTNPSAITFLRINADNTVDALSATNFRTAIGAGTGDGTVTSVSGTTNRVTSTSGTTPALDISATFEALLGKVASPLSQFAATTSAQLRGVLSDENGTGVALFDSATSPTFITPALGTPSALVGTNITGTAAGLTAGNVTTNANLTGAVTSVGNATSLGSFSSANLLGALTDETGSGVAVFGTTPTIATPVINGLPTGTGIASAATASTVVTRDSSANININNVNVGYTTTATAAGTTTLLVGSTMLQYFTGSTTQIVALPVTSTLALGFRFIIVNNSTGLVTVNSSGGNLIATIPTLGSMTVTCILTSGTSAASWSSSVSPSVYINSGLQSLGNLDTWDATPPSGASSKVYQWIQDGKTVQLWVTITYATAGTSNTSIDISWPADMPLPIEPTGRTATSDVLFVGGGRIGTSTSQTPNAVRPVYIVKTGTLTYKINMSTASTNSKVLDAYVSFVTT